jgi:hypothetical protein
MTEPVHRSNASMKGKPDLLFLRSSKGLDAVPQTDSHLFSRDSFPNTGAPDRPFAPRRGETPENGSRPSAHVRRRFHSEGRVSASPRIFRMRWRRRESNPRPPYAASSTAAGADSSSNDESGNAPNDSHERPRIDDDPRSQRGPSSEPAAPPVVPGDEPQD